MPTMIEVRNDNRDLKAEAAKLRALLAEAADWLCSHESAIERRKIGATIDFCSDCHNYIRSDADFTLRDRVREAVK